MTSMSIKCVVIIGAAALMFQACSEPQEAPTGVQNEVSVHGEGWMSKSSPQFHGAVLADQNYNAEDCRPCHGSQYDGGTSGVSCYQCHASYPHPPSGWVNGSNSHHAFLKSNSYDLESCQGCHGQDYSVVKIDNSCLTCHPQQNGPEACNTCHGNNDASAADLINAAPPLGLGNETAATTPAVGAHRAHFDYYRHLPAAQLCQECHAVPDDFFAQNHIDDNTRAEALFNGPLGNLITEGGNRVPQVVYDFNANTCSNSYCHGNWGLRKSNAGQNDFVYASEVMTGATNSPKWTESGAACGSCHGLPPAGHTDFPLTACSICHIGVVDAFGLTIIDSTKHANGKINVFAEEKPMH